MKILSLEIHNIRGIKEAILAPNGNNFVIWGPNGSGKSAVVDAIDFLLTGKIARLIGDGTEGITLTKHGPHIDYTKDPSKSFVKAVVQVPNISGTVILRRIMANPGNLEVQEADISQLDEILELAGRRQHSLSRREILRYVAAQAGKRSAEVQALLNLEELETARRAIGRTLTQAKTNSKNAKQGVTDAEMNIKDTLSLDTFTQEGMIGKVNELRGLLNGSPLVEISSKNLKGNISPPPPTGVAAILNPKLIENQCSSLQSTLQSETPKVTDADSMLRVDIQAINANVQAMKDAERLQLIRLGISLLDETGECPLCGWIWDPEEIASNLMRREENARAISEIIDRINLKAEVVSNAASSVKQYIDKFADAAKALGLNPQEIILQECAASLSAIVGACVEPLKNYPPAGLNPNQIGALCMAPELYKEMDNVVVAAHKAVPIVTPEQTAWDTLTTLSAQLVQWQKAVEVHSKADRFFRRATLLSSSFAKVRETNLENLYGLIKSRFTELYKCLHDPDEDGFTARLGSNGQFEVDFYGRGLHPPMALHSEGHQDSMGICLYLALAEHLTKDKIALTVLDDVVMSVDSLHRRQICALLKEHFPERQFLITTHDKTWARELQTEGVVQRNNSIEFTRWTLEGGPCLELEDGLWARIETDLGKQDVSRAAFSLRNGSERFFEHVCDALKAPIRYKLNGAWDLSDFMSGAIGKFRKLVREAKASAQSWGNQEKYDKLVELETIASQIIQRTECERWMVNAAVHFNKWHELSEPDFRPIVEAFRDCFSLFHCQSCGGLIRVSEEQGTDTSVRCACQDVNWNLTKKKN